MSLVVINGKRSKGEINKNIYGQFAEHLGRCIYEGLFVGKESDIPNEGGLRLDVVKALQRLEIPVLRWPGGCFADTYHWKDGIGPLSERKKIVNTNWGGITEDNSFGTDEFILLEKLLGCDSYISGNVGSGTPAELSDWIEYCNSPRGSSPMAKLRELNGNAEPFNLKYWGIGNEAWDCGGNMRPEYYADLLRQFSTYMRNYSDFKIEKIASGASEGDYHWTEVLAERASSYVDAFSLHYYTRPNMADWSHKGSATGFTENEYWATLKATLHIEELIERHYAIIERFDKEKRIKLAIDEWGTWYDVEEGTNPGFLYQQNTIRDAQVAAINLNIFNNHAEKISMANIAQMVNVLQAMVLTEGDKMVLTPTYHVFEMYKKHMGAKQVESYVETNLVGLDDVKVPNLTVSASEKEGKLLITVSNLNLEKEDLTFMLTGVGKVKSVKARELSGAMGAFNTFSSPETVKPVDKGVKVDGQTLTTSLGPSGVLAIEVELG